MKLCRSREWRAEFSAMTEVPRSTVPVGLLKKRLLAPRCANGQKVAGASDASAVVADGRFLVRPQTHSEVGFLNSPTVPSFSLKSSPSRPI